MKGENLVPDQSAKIKRSKSREVSSRFLSSSSGTEYAVQSPNQKPAVSPLRHKPRSSTDNRKLKSLESSGFMRGLWPSKSSSLDTLGDHLKHDRHQDHHETSNYNSLHLSRQRSCTEFTRFENEKESSSKENHKPVFGPSVPYTGKFKFPGKSSKASSSKLFDLVDDRGDNSNVDPGRFSVDENALRRKSFGRKPNCSSVEDSESGYSDIFSGTSFGSSTIGNNSVPASYMAPTASSRQYGIEVSSKYLQDLSSKSRRWSADSTTQKPSSAENSPRNFTIKNAIKKANSFSKNGTVTSKLGLSPGRYSSPPVFGEKNGTLTELSNSKPPSSPSRGNKVGSFISIGLELLKGRRSTLSGSSYVQPGGITEDVHQLKLLHNRLVQWRYSNARADAVNQSIQQQAERNLTCALIALRTLLQSIQQKKLMLEKEKLKMKLNRILYSQIRPLEAYGDMERQYKSVLSTITDHLYSAACKLPLVEGAQARLHSTTTGLHHASDLAASIKSMLSTYSPTAEETVAQLAELAEVVTQEKLLLEECLELFNTISILEVQELSLKCTTIQGKTLQQRQQLSPS